MSNYPDNIRDFDDCPGSPFYEEPPTCEECDHPLEFECDGDGGVDEVPHDCNIEKLYKVVITKTIYVKAIAAMDAAIFATDNPDAKGITHNMPSEVDEAPENEEVYEA